MIDKNLEISRMSPAELQRLADVERAKYLRALFKRLFARWSGRRASAGTPQLSGAKA